MTTFRYIFTEESLESYEDGLVAKVTANYEGTDADGYTHSVTHSVDLGDPEDPNDMVQFENLTAEIVEGWLVADWEDTRKNVPPKGNANMREFYQKHITKCLAANKIKRAEDAVAKADPTTEAPLPFAVTK